MPLILLPEYGVQLQKGKRQRSFDFFNLLSTISDIFSSPVRSETTSVSSGLKLGRDVLCMGVQPVMAREETLMPKRLVTANERDFFLHELGYCDMFWIKIRVVFSKQDAKQGKLKSA